ncbi:hypothetical protein BH18THE2_BH18THE2_24820 [soil metagenome]
MDLEKIYAKNGGIVVVLSSRETEISVLSMKLIMNQVN